MTRVRVSTARPFPRRRRRWAAAQPGASAARCCSVMCVKPTATPLTPGTAPTCGPHLRLDVRLERAAGHRQPDRRRRRRRRRRSRARDHAELDHVAPQLGIDDLAQGLRIASGAGRHDGMLPRTDAGTSGPMREQLGDAWQRALVAGRHDPRARLEVERRRPSGRRRRPAARGPAGLAHQQLGRPRCRRRRVRLSESRRRRPGPRPAGRAPAPASPARARARRVPGMRAAAAGDQVPGWWPRRPRSRTASCGRSPPSRTPWRRSRRRRARRPTPRRCRGRRRSRSARRAMAGPSATAIETQKKPAGRAWR